MKLAVCNLAWPKEYDELVIPKLVAEGFTGLEIAPQRWRRELAKSNGLSICAMQALCFGKPELQLLGSPGPLRDHLRKCADIAADLGVKVMVFGSPANRRREAGWHLSDADAFKVAADFFRGIGEEVYRMGIALAIEPLTAHDECNFITTSIEAAKLVRAVNSPGFRLHLDTASMSQNPELPYRSIKGDKDILAHVHARGWYIHKETAEALRAVGYEGWVSLEGPSGGFESLPQLLDALRFVARIYGDK